MHSPLPPSAQEDLSYPHASIARFPLSCPYMASSVTAFLIHFPPWYFPTIFISAWESSFPLCHCDSLFFSHYYVPLETTNPTLYL